MTCASHGAFPYESSLPVNNLSKLEKSWIHVWAEKENRSIFKVDANKKFKKAVHSRQWTTRQSSLNQPFAFGCSGSLCWCWSCWCWCWRFRCLPIVSNRWSSFSWSGASGGASDDWFQMHTVRCHVPRAWSQRNSSALWIVRSLTFSDTLSQRRRG